MKQSELDEVIKLHRLWLNGYPEGSRANLRGADLYGANLHGANLRKANLSGADLRRANLRRADLREADLRGADLYVADLRRANLHGANLRKANLEIANLREANLREANLRDIKLPFEIQIDTSLKERILQAVEEPQNDLDMESWHTCGTSHCIAGWATTLHPQGKEIENKSSTYLAGRLLLGLNQEEANIFFKSEEEAMEWLKS